MGEGRFSIDDLIKIVENGGIVKTGVNVYDDRGILLLEKNVLVNKVNPLLVIKKAGLRDIPIDPSGAGGLWDKDGRQVPLGPARKALAQKAAEKAKPVTFSGLEKKFREIEEIKQLAHEKHDNAKKNIKRVISDIKKTGGEFDYDMVEHTVTDLFEFITQNESAFSYLTKEIFSYDDYLYNHSINVCTIGTAAVKRFNEHFSSVFNNYLNSIALSTPDNDKDLSDLSFVFYHEDELHDIAIGYFLHDVGKVLIPNEILNKKGKLSDGEFELVKSHSYEKGIEVLEKNKHSNPFIVNSVKYHHGPLFAKEMRCYPQDRLPAQIPSYVKVCKLADIYDAMTSKRSYKEAINPVGVVTDLFRTYAVKDRMLQFILHSFVKVVGVYPAGSIVTLLNNQMAYIVDSAGPLILPFTDTYGDPLTTKPDPINLGDKDAIDKSQQIDQRKPLTSPLKAHDLLPGFLREIIFKL